MIKIEAEIETILPAEDWLNEFLNWLDTRGEIFTGDVDDAQA